MSRSTRPTMVAAGTVGWLAIIVGAEQAPLLAGVGDEQHRPLRPCRLGGELPRGLQHRRDAGGIVERAIVDRVLARLGIGLDAEMVEMAHQHDMLGGQRGIGAAQQADDFGAGEILPLAFGFDRQASAQARSRAGAPFALASARTATSDLGAPSNSFAAISWEKLTAAAAGPRAPSRPGHCVDPVDQRAATAAHGGRPAAPRRHCAAISR